MGEADASIRLRNINVSCDILYYVWACGCGIVRDQVAPVQNAG